MDAGRRYRIVSTSSNVNGQQKAVLAGLAVTVSTLPGLSAGLRPLRDVTTGLRNSDQDALDLVEVHLVTAAIVELGCSGAGVVRRGHTYPC